MSGGPADWGTPPEVFDPFHWRFNFNFDAAANEQNHKLPIWSDDSLGISWYERNWCNPPFSRGQLERFVDKAIDETAARRRTWMLVRGDWSTDWWRKLHQASSRAWLITPRIRFITGDGTQARAVDRNCHAIFEVDGHGPLGAVTLWDWRKGKK